MDCSSISRSERKCDQRDAQMLARLARDPGKALTREQLMSDVWDENWHGSTKTLDMHVSTLRRKLGAAGSSITTLRGVGFRLEKDA